MSYVNITAFGVHRLSYFLRGRVVLAMHEMQATSPERGLSTDAAAQTEEQRVTEQGSSFGLTATSRLGSKPLLDGYHMPAEWEPHERCSGVRLRADRD